MERFIPNTLPFTNRRLPLRVLISYAFDYGIIVALAVIYSLIDIIVTPFSQHFSLLNYTIQYPFAVKERIPIPIAGVICVLFPMIAIAFYTLVIDGLFSHRRKGAGSGWSSIYRPKERLWELNCGILGLWLAGGAAFVITGSLKNLCGKPRPDLIARCQPLAGSLDSPVFGLSNRTICTQTDQAIMADGFRSFPSGHSSTAFAGLFYLSLYLAGKLHVLDNRGEVWRTIIVLIPTLAASCVAMSRIMDARHHLFDVLFGSALGMLVAWASYRQYFPPLSETWKKGRAHPIRTWGTEIKPPPITDNRMVQKDSDMEPFRTQDAAPPSSGSPDDLARQSTRYPGNVFRDQVYRSQQQRGGPDGTSENPYMNPISPIGMTADGGHYISPRQRDGDWSADTSSSSQEDFRRPSSINPGTFEMQPRERVSAAPTQISDPEQQRSWTNQRSNYAQRDSAPSIPSSSSSPSKPQRSQPIRIVDPQQAEAVSPPPENHRGERVLA